MAAVVKADPHEMIVVDVPERRIVDDETWLAVQAHFTKRAPYTFTKPHTRYPLTGIARCAHCGGAIACARTRVNSTYIKMYGCRRSGQRGPRACPVSVRQEMAEVENALVAYLEDDLLTEEMLQTILAKYRTHASKLLRGQPKDVDEMERELRDLRAEQKKLAKAVAISDDIPELVSTMTRNQLRVKVLEEQISTARRAPDQLAVMMARAEKTARERMTSLRDAVTKPEKLREVFLACFPLGLPLSSGRDGSRSVWEVNGLAEFPLLSERDSCLLSRDPKGT